MKKYKNIKLLQKAGITVKQTQSLTGRSNATVSTIYRATDYVDYKAVLREYTENKYATKAVSATDTITQPTDNAKDVADALINIYEKLDAMHESIKWIENHTEAKATKSFLRRN